jgi:hypothetical protein
MLRRFVLLVLAQWGMVSFLCSGAALAQDWKPLGAGVSYRVGSVDTGAVALIGFAGWSVSEDSARKWLHALSEASGLRVGAVYAVQGPKDPAFAVRDVDTQALAHALAALQSNAKYERIVVVAHSSGSFVAHHALNQLRSKAGHAKIFYFNLDGGLGTGDIALQPAIAKKLGGTFAVYARQGTMQSPNAPAMQKWLQHYTGSMGIAIDNAVSDCTSPWCVHETLIIQRPYKTHGFDLERDYGAITPERPVQAGYLRQLPAVEMSAAER